MSLPKEYNWWLSHPEIISEYEGEYIAIVDEEIVAHGKDLHAVLEEARKTGKEPLIDKVETSDKAIVL